MYTATAIKNGLTIKYNLPHVGNSVIDNRTQQKYFCTEVIELWHGILFVLTAGDMSISMPAKVFEDHDFSVEVAKEFTN